MVCSVCGQGGHNKRFHAKSGGEGARQDLPAIATVVRPKSSRSNTNKPKSSGSQYPVEYPTASPVFVALDIETTKGGIYKCDVVQLAAKLLVEEELNVPKPSRTVRHSFATFVKPERDIAEGDLQYANCTVEDVARAAPFRDAWSSFMRWLAEIQTEDTTSGRPFVLLAHNGAVFDLPVLGFHVEAAGLAWPPELQFICDSLRLVRQHHMDELQELAAQRAQEPKTSIGALHLLIFGHEAAGLHDASKDVDALIDVFSAPWINAEWRQATYPCAWLLERSRAAKSAKEQPRPASAGTAGQPNALTHADSDSDVDDEHAHALLAEAADEAAGDFFDAGAETEDAEPDAHQPDGNVRINDTHIPNVWEQGRIDWPPIAEFTGPQPGPTAYSWRHGTRGPMDFFEALFHRAEKTLLQQTNLYYKQHIAELTLKDFFNWLKVAKPWAKAGRPAAAAAFTVKTRFGVTPRTWRCHVVTLQELRGVLGVLIMAGEKGLSAGYSRQWWSNHVRYSQPLLKQMFASGRRFNAILRHLHAVDNYAQRPQRGDADFDPLWKISGLMADVAAEFRKAFHPSKYICLDESMVKYEGRHSMKIYNPKKPIKWGFRVETVCDSETSFILHMKVVGKLDEDGAQGGGRGGGKTHSLVMQMLEPFVGKNHVAIMDNRYMQVKTAHALKLQNTHTVGTLRANRLPRSISKSSQLQQLRKGDSIFWTASQHRWETKVDGNPDPVQHVVDTTHAAVVMWHDCKVVGVLTTSIPPTENPSAAVRRSGRGFIEVDRPSAFTEYNAAMGGVDLADQYEAEHGVALRRSKRNWLTILCHIINATVHNSHILYNLAVPPVRRLPASEFRYLLALRLAHRTEENGQLSVRALKDAWFPALVCANAADMPAAGASGGPAAAPAGVPPAAPAGVPPAATDGVAPAAPDGVPPAAPDGVPPAAPDGVPPAAPDGVPPAAPVPIAAPVPPAAPAADVPLAAPDVPPAAPPTVPPAVPPASPAEQFAAAAATQPQAPSAAPAPSAEATTPRKKTPKPTVMRPSPRDNIAALLSPGQGHTTHGQKKAPINRTLRMLAVAAADAPPIAVPAATAATPPAAALPPAQPAKRKIISVPSPAPHPPRTKRRTAFAATLPVAAQALEVAPAHLVSRSSSHFRCFRCTGNGKGESSTNYVCTGCHGALHLKCIGPAHNMPASPALLQQLLKTQ